MKVLFDPQVFSYIILTLYALNSINFLLRKEWAQGVYWMGAFIITSAVTFGFKH